MSAFKKKPAAKYFFLRQAICNILFILFFVSYAYGNSTDDVLLTVHDREITLDEFLYHLHKSDSDIDQQNIRQYLESFIDFQLKLAQAREERVHHTIPFINELTEYRLLLASPYLTDKGKEEEFVREASERLEFEVRANQILVKIDQDAGPEDTLKAYSEAIEIRNRIRKGESFEQLAIGVSADPRVIINPGNPGWFTAFEIAYPVESAVYKMKPGGLSSPVRSSEGYHIIQLIDRRKSTKELKNELEIKNLIYEAEDERAMIIKGAFVEKLKQYWDFKENRAALDIIFDLADERVFKGNWIPPADQHFDETLFTIDGKHVYQTDFINFMTEHELTNAQMSIREYIFSNYQEFASSRLITYENYKLEEKYPEFRFQFHEYRDAMLLLAITRQKVWLKAQYDTTGLEEFHDGNKEKYMWGDRISASIFTADDERSAKRAAKMVSKSFHKGENDLGKILDQINIKTGGPPITAKQGIFSKGDHPITDQIKWEAGISGISHQENKYQFVFVHDILKPEYKSMDEAYDSLLADYQNYLMKQWIDELRGTYNVQINEALLSTICSGIHFEQ